MTDLAVAVDIGGTFTDVRLSDLDDGSMWSAKTPTTPADPSIGFASGVERVLALSGRPAQEIVRVLHGTTIATNAILESKGSRTGLVTTRGFKYVLEIGRHDSPRWANLNSWVKPRRPVSADDIREVTERVVVDGTVSTPLDEADCRAAAEYFKASGVNAIAICFLHSYLAPEHELRARELIAEVHPEAWISISSEVLPMFREYERSMATALNSYVMPTMSAYMARLQQRLKTLGIEAPLYVMKSNGGVIGASTVVRQPAFTALSGPAAGVIGARYVGATGGFADLVSIDVGGTSADVCLIRDGEAETTLEGHIGDWPFATPMIDIHTVGAGGGSIASLTAAGTLLVGPASAGADPGPACYGRGGELPTVTDANLVLGRLPTGLAGGELGLDSSAARDAVERHIAEPLGMDVVAAAAGVIDVVNNNMMGAIRRITVERGIDPRDFALLGFGGAGPLHATSIGRLLGMRTTLFGRSPGVLSAEGLLASDVRNDFVRSCASVDPTAEDVAGILKMLDEEAYAWLADEGVSQDKQVVTWQADLRYPNQVFELTIALERSATGQADLARLREAFHAEHERLYTYSLRDAAVELIALRASAIGQLAEQSAMAGDVTTESAAAGMLPEQLSTQQVYFAELGSFTDCPVYDRTQLPPGTRLDGPLVLVQMDTTILVLPGQDVVVDSAHNLVVTDHAVAGAKGWES